MKVKETVREDIQCKVTEYFEGNCICTVVTCADLPTSVDIKHWESPIATPTVTYYEGHIQWDFSTMIILDEKDVLRMMENTKELMSFCDKIKELLKNDI